jgi:polysaccharide biosynthesis protein PslH
MKILWLTSYYPSFPDGAPHVWNYLMLRQLSRQHRIEYGALADLPEHARKFLRDHDISIFNEPTVVEAPVGERDQRSLFSVRNLEKVLHLDRLRFVEFVKRLRWQRRTIRHWQSLLSKISDEQYDVVHCENSELGSILKTVPQSIPKTMTVENVYSFAMEYEIAIAENALNRQWLQCKMAVIRAIEMADIRNADLCFAMSEKEKIWIRKEAGTASTLLPICIDCEYFEQPASELEFPVGDPCLVYTATMSFEPHVDAVTHFVRHILPDVQAAFPRATFLAVGKNPPPEIVAMQTLNSHVIVTGSVPDVRPYVRKADFVVVPMRFGAGIRIKIMEAACASRPIIATAVGAEGLGMTPGVHYVEAESAEDFVKAIRKLKTDREFRENMIQAAKKFVWEHFSYKILEPRLESEWQQLIHNGKKN